MALPDPLGSLNTGVSHEEPTNETEEKLVGIWKEVLGLERIGILDDFFELGGHSLKAVQVVSLIIERYGIRMKVTDVFTNSTIKELAGLMDQMRYYSEKLPTEQSMMLLNAKKDKHVFAFPPIIGYSIGFHRLAGVVDNYSFYSFDYIEDKDKVDIYADMITSVQKEGPYVLLGYSAGGNLGYEVAKKLIEKGHRVSDLILLDSYAEKHESFSITHAVVNEMLSKFLVDYSLTHGGEINIDNVVEEIMKRSQDYAEFYNSLLHDQVIDTKIHIVKSDSSTDVDLEVQWSQLTSKGVKTYKGTGPHADMVFAQYSDANGELINKILRDEISAAHPLKEEHGSCAT